MGGVSSLLLPLNSASCLPVLRLALLFLAFYAAMTLARPEAPPRRTRRRHRQALKASGCGEDELKGACQSPGTCCHAPLETLTLAHGLRLVEERIQHVASHLDEVLILPSMNTFAGSSFSSSSWESSSSFLCSSSSVTLRETSQSWSVSLCHVGETVSVVGWEGPSRPTQVQPLPRPPVQSQQPAGWAQTSAPALDSNIGHKQLPSQLGALTLFTESLAQMAPSRPARPPPEGHPGVTFDLNRVLRPGSAAWEELDRPVRTGRIQQEQDFPVPRKPPRPLLPPAPQPPTPGQPVLGERDTEQPWDLLPAPPTRGFPAQLPPPPRADSRPRCSQGSQEPCVCPMGSPPPKAPRAVPAPDISPARRVSTVAAKLQGHVAQKCLEIQTKAFPRLVSESHRNAAFPRETIPARPPQPPGELGEGRAAAFPARGQDPSPPLRLPVRRMQLAMRWGLPPLDPELPAKPPLPIPARRAGPESREMETNFLLAKQEWGRPDAPWKALGASRAPVPKPCTSRPRVEVFPSLGELRFLQSDTKKQLEFHLVKMQVQQRWGLPRRVQDSLGEFTAPPPGQRGRLSPPHGGGVAPYPSRLLPPSWKAQSGHWPPRAPAERGMDTRVLPADTRRQLARSYSRKYPGAARGEERPAHRPAWQTEGQGTGSSGSQHRPTPGQDVAVETGRSDGAAGSQASPGPCDLLAGVAPTSSPPGPDRTEQTLTATLHVHRSEGGAAGSGEKLELHMERKGVSGEGLRLGIGAGQDLQVAPEPPVSLQRTSSTIAALVTGQVAHHLQLQRLMEVLSRASPRADHVSTGHSAGPHPGAAESHKSQGTQVSGELLGLRDTAPPPGLHGTMPPHVCRDQPPARVCRKCNKRRRKRPAGSAGADSPGRSPGVPQRGPLGDAGPSSSHGMPVVWLLPASRRARDGKGRKAPSRLPTTVSVATSTTGLSPAGPKTPGSPEGSPPQASRPRTPSPPRSRVPCLRRFLTCLKQTLSKLQSKVTKSRPSPGARRTTRH